jgi:hypothetical protein
MEFSTPQDDLTYWESVNQTTGWGRYLTEIENWIVLSASQNEGGPGALLEVGSDGGRWCSVLTNQGWKVIRTDIRPEALAVCQRRLPTAKCILVKPSDTTLCCSSNTLNLVHGS